MMKLNYILFYFLLFASSANGLGAETIQLETTQQEFTAGETIILTFSGTQDASIKLYCANSYGTTIIKPTIENQQLQYMLPTQITSKIGMVNWKLLDKTTSLSGSFKIIPQTQPVAMETYVGPPSIEAGEIDYTMLVVIPTDALDNPLKENTDVILKRQFLANQQEETIQTKNLLAYQRIYAPTESGRMLLATECLELNSKEYTVNIMPAISTDFEIFAKRPHEYADGNQITTFTTSVLRDKNNNVISDGSYVEFFITNNDGNLLKTAGMTIDGVATAKMIHPDHAETWNIKAYVKGISESNTISLRYTQVIEDFTVKFSENNRNIEVGPLQSFMKQLIPDGLQVSLTISQNGKTLETYIKESRDGFANFELNPNIFKDGNYDLEITTAGITKTFQAKKLW
jgi:hypothetical protein